MENSHAETHRTDNTMKIQNQTQRLKDNVIQLPKVPIVCYANGQKLLNT